MTKTLPLWAALLFGVICGAVIGTIVAAFYLTLALKTGFGSFDMLALWKASAGTRAAHPEAFKVGFGAVGFGGEHGAGLHLLAVDMDRAGTALAGVAADMSAGQAQFLAQERDEKRAPLDLAGHGLAIDRHRNFHLFPPVAGRSSRLAAFRTLCV